MQGMAYLSDKNGACGGNEKAGVQKKYIRGTKKPRGGGQLNVPEVG